MSWCNLQRKEELTAHYATKSAYKPKNSTMLFHSPKIITLLFNSFLRIQEMEIIHKQALKRTSVLACADIKI